MKFKSFCLLIIISLLSFRAFADTTKDLLLEAAKELKATTLLLEEQQTINSNLNNKITALEAENKNLKDTLFRANALLKQSNTLLTEAKDRIKDDQDEITNLRNKLNTAINNITEIKYFKIGADVSYPLGAGINFSITIPKTYFYVFANINGYLDPSFKYLLALGGGVKF